jgi:monofunctional biosynthetic peptidoglycan transglycosylase
VFGPGTQGREWLSVNDDVMGGISRGRHRITENGTLEFSGYLSLANNGGFASIRSAAGDLGLAGYEGIALRVRGDGRSYHVNLHTTARVTPGSWRAQFDTAAGNWTEIRIPFRSFRWTMFGRPVPARQLDPGRAVSLGFTIADKKEGEFRLEVEWVTAYRGAGAPPDMVDVMAARPELRTFVAVLRSSGLEPSFRKESPMTVFAPTDAAFAGLPDEFVAELARPENRLELLALMLRHVAPGRIGLLRRSARMLAGSDAAITVAGKASLDGVGVLAADLDAANGVVHVIDAVLEPVDAPPSTSAEAVAMIRDSIELGAPLFNAGNAEVCAAIYELCARRLADAGRSVLPEDVAGGLRSAVEDPADRDPTGKAWALRAALDRTLSALQQ